MERLPPPSLPAWLERQVPFRRSTVEVLGHRIHLMEAGSGRPVLLLHGNPTWSFLYRKVAQALAGEKLWLVMPDLPGLGFSDRPPSDFHSLDRHAEVVGSLVEALQMRDLIFVGQDWGGPIGLRALADRSERVSGLVLLNTVVGPPRSGFRPAAFHRFARVPLVSTAAFRLFGFPQNALHRAQADPSSIRGDVARAYRYPLRGIPGAAAPLALARMVPDSLFHPSVPGLVRCQAFVEGFRGPSAIVWGRKDPVLGKALRRVEQLLPAATVTVTEAGHFLQEEVPEAIAEAVVRVAAVPRSTEA